MVILFRKGNCPGLDTAVQQVTCSIAVPDESEMAINDTTWPMQISACYRLKSKFLPYK